MTAVLLSTLASRQAAFAAALLDPELPVPLGLLGPARCPSTRRFNVYRNNVVSGLTEALRDAFPATARLVGEDFFEALARTYIAREPPRSPLLFEYGGGLPNFIAGFSPLADLPYLSDVARIERAWLEAYHAREAPSFDPAGIEQIPPDERPLLRIELHPSIRVVRSRYPALSIWHVNVYQSESTTVDLNQGSEDALIVRAQAEVRVEPLLPGGGEFLQAVGMGDSVLEATSGASAADERFDLAATLAQLLRAGCFVGLKRPCLSAATQTASSET